MFDGSGKDGGGWLIGFRKGTSLVRFAHVRHLPDLFLDPHESHLEAGVLPTASRFDRDDILSCFKIKLRVGRG